MRDTYIYDSQEEEYVLDAADRAFYTTDANYNVTALLDSTGAVIERYVYSAYGETTVYSPTWTNPAAPTTDGPLYCGYFFDAETANYLARHRYYNTALATWIGRDPVKSEPNLYAYVGANPIAKTDPYGLYTVREQDCIQDCEEGCANEYGWYNPQRYICQGYCDNACTGTPDILDRLGDLSGWVCSKINALANSNTVKCTCGLLVSVRRNACSIAAGEAG